MLAGAALIATAAFLVYYPSLSGEFVLDDGLLLTDNPLIKNPAGLYRFWFTTQPQDYWPITNTTLWLEWRLWGEHPTGYHVTNLLLHIAACLLIWTILRKLSIPGGFLAALIFAVHPVNVESVAWVAQRKNTLAIVFFLLSILWYLTAEMRGEVRREKGRSDRSPKTKDQFPVPQAKPETTRLASSRFYWLSLAAFLMAMLSKGSVVVLPALLLGIIWWRRPLRRADFMATAPFFAVAVVLGGVDAWFQTHGSEAVIRDAGFVERLLGAGAAVWFYLSKAILPIDLAFIYPQWKITPNGLRWWLPLAAAGIVTVVLWRYRKGWSRPLLFAWGFFCVALLPALGFTDVGYMQYSLVADHYQHVALVAVVALAAAGFSICRRRAQGWVGVAALGSAAVIVVALGFAAWKQNALYRRAVTLYSDTLEKNHDCWMAHDNLGLALVNENRLPEAIAHHKAALKLKPDNPNSHINLGNALSMEGRMPEAIQQFQAALETRSDAAKAHYNLGIALMKMRRIQEAIEHYEEARRLNPEYLQAYINLGVAYDRIGMVPKAIENYQRSLELDPNSAEAHFDLGNAYMKMGRSHQEQAIEHLKRALELKPDYADADNNLGYLLARIGRNEEAIEYCNRALNLKPDFAQARFNLGNALQSCGRLQEAIAQYEEAMALDPGDFETPMQLALTFAQAHRSDDAVAAARKARDLARRANQTKPAELIEAWLRDYNVRRSKTPNAPSAE
jgi:tetratricopeptide (TPR) repeat protein